MKIGIIGMGYVGLPLALQFAAKGVHVTGIELNRAKVEMINSGCSYISHIASALVSEQARSGRFRATDDFASVRDCDAIIICVPTPLNKNREPDISCILDAGRAIAPHLGDGVVVILESTTYPGTTDGELRETLEGCSGKKAGVDFYLAFSPEREDPGNKSSHVGVIPKVVGGLTLKCRLRAIEVYKIAVLEIIPVSSCRVAEAPSS